MVIHSGTRVVYQSNSTQTTLSTIACSGQETRDSTAYGACEILLEKHSVLLAAATKHCGAPKQAYW